MGHVGRVRRSWALAVALLAGLAMLVLPAPPAAAGGESYVERINGERAAQGLSPLAVETEAAAVAARWSAHMAKTGQLAHNPNLPREITSDWEKLAENVGMGTDDASLHRAFMDSASHRSNILDPALTHVGVAVVTDQDGIRWVTQVFLRLPAAAPAPAAQAPVAAPAPAPAPEPVAAPHRHAEAAANAPAPAQIPEPVAPVAPSPPARVVLVLERLRALDAGH